MKVIASLLSATAALLVLGSSETAQAQAPKTTIKTAEYSEQNVNGDQVVKFTGDELAAATDGPYGNILRRLPGVIHAGLIRPRVNFVPELLKSVENL
jgi:hypothetical protein